MGTSTPCGTCPKPLYLDPEHEEAWEVFLRLSSQLRVAGMGTVLGVDLVAFPIICDVLEVPHSERKITLDKVLLINNIAVKYWNKSEEDS